MKKNILFILSLLALSGLAHAQSIGIGSSIFTPVNMLDVKGSMSIGAGYAGVNTAPVNGLLIQGNTGMGLTSPVYKLDVNGVIRNNADVISTSANTFRSIYGNYGVFDRNDGSDFYMLLTNAGDQYGSWNALRPFRINLPSGDVYINSNSTSIYSRSSDGYVGIGTTSPVSKLDVRGKSTFTIDGTTECCGNDATIAIGENTAGTGRTARISFHNSGVSEGSLELYNGSPRRLRIYDNQAQGMGLQMSGPLYVDGTGNSYIQGSTGIGTASPAAKLDIIGKIKITDGTQAIGRVLTSDANGLASWQTSASLGQGYAQANATACTRINGDNTSTYTNTGACTSGYSTGTWFNVPGLSVTRTITAGNFVSVNVHIRWKTDNYTYWAPETIWFRILRDGTEIARSSMFTQDPDWYILEGDGNIFYYDAGATAGVHTYSVQTAMANNSAGIESYWIQDGYLTLIEIH